VTDEQSEEGTASKRSALATVGSYAGLGGVMLLTQEAAGHGRGRHHASLATAKPSIPIASDDVVAVVAQEARDDPNQAEQPPGHAEVARDADCSLGPDIRQAFLQ